MAEYRSTDYAYQCEMLDQEALGKLFEQFDEKGICRFENVPECVDDTYYYIGNVLVGGRIDYLDSYWLKFDDRFAVQLVGELLGSLLPQ